MGLLYGSKEITLLGHFRCYVDISYHIKSCQILTEEWVLCVFTFARSFSHSWKNTSITAKKKKKKKNLEILKPKVYIYVYI